MFSLEIELSLVVTIRNDYIIASLNPFSANMIISANTLIYIWSSVSFSVQYTIWLMHASAM